MNTYKLILKGILLYTTIIFTALFVCGVDSIKNIDVIFLDVCIIAGLVLGLSIKKSILSKS